MTQSPTDLTPLWRIRLFGGLALQDHFGNTTTRFRSQKVSGMLAYLALHLGSYCSREALYEILWQDEDYSVVANRFRVALASLRKQLEPEGTVFGSVLDVSEPRMVRLRPETVSCDVFEFRTLWRSGRKAEALQLAKEPLLPSFIDEWAVNNREHYEHLIETLSPNSAIEAHETPPVLRSDTIPRLEASSEKRLSVLPLYLTRFFGREKERQQLRALLQENRLVTLTGMGGIGKTRLAVEVAGEFGGSSLFVPLETVTDAAQIGEVLAKTLGATLERHAPLDEQLSRCLEPLGETLLLLDNAEHLTESIAAFALSLLAHSPALHLLIVSRQRLGLAGEAVCILAPLEIPAESPSLENGMQSPCIALFVDRAAKARPDFVYSSRNADAIAEICVRLEGIPLAIELAAAHVISQTPGQLASALRQSVTDLKSRQRGLPERHRSLQTVFDTSLKLLPPDVRAFFLALAVFQNQWTIEAARDMTGSERSAEFLERLVESSLLLCREDERLGVMCFSLMETVRQLALQARAEGKTTEQWQTIDNLIINGDFEADRPDALWISVRGGLFAHPFLVATGWQGVDSVNINVPSFAAFPNGVPHGTNTAVVGDHTMQGRLFQNVAAQLTAGTTYTLSAWIGNRLDYSGSGRTVLETVSGEILADSGTITPEKGTFQKVILTFTAENGSPLLGENLRVALERSEGLQANFDGVCLTTSSAE